MSFTTSQGSIVPVCSLLQCSCLGTSAGYSIKTGLCSKNISAFLCLQWHSPKPQALNIYSCGGAIPVKCGLESISHMPRMDVIYQLVAFHVQEDPTYKHLIKFVGFPMSAATCETDPQMSKSLRVGRLSPRAHCVHQRRWLQARPKAKSSRVKSLLEEAFPRPTLSPHESWRLLAAVLIPRSRFLGATGEQERCEALDPRQVFSSVL